MAEAKNDPTGKSAVSIAIGGDPTGNGVACAEPNVAKVAATRAAVLTLCLSIYVSLSKIEHERSRCQYSGSYHAASSITGR
jgi:hypothetical protein